MKSLITKDVKTFFIKTLIILIAIIFLYYLMSPYEKCIRYYDQSDDYKEGNYYMCQHLYRWTSNNEKIYQPLSQDFDIICKDSSQFSF